MQARRVLNRGMVVAPGGESSLAGLAARRRPFGVLPFLLLGACSVASPSAGKGALAASGPQKGSVSAQAATFTTLASEEIEGAALDYPKREAVVEAPLSLTASDGTGLFLRSLRAEAVVEGPLAFTQLHLTFENPQPRVIEGRFTITMPPNAAISRFAMKIGHRWQEAEVVERQRARQVYEDFLHRKQDPALLENAAGNQFSARVFPIAASGEKELIVSFSHELERPGEPYRLPLEGLPEIDDVQVRVLRKDLARTVKAGGWTAFEREHYKPERDFELPAAEQARSSLSNGAMLVARITPELDAKTDEIASALLLFDTSASRAPGFANEVARLKDTVDALAKAMPSMRLEVAAFDNDVAPIYEGSVSAFGAEALEALLARRPLGGSNLERALSWAKTRAQHDRLVLFSDAIVTFGEQDRGALSRLVKGLPMKRLDVVLVGGIHDERVAGALTRGALARDGIVVSGERDPAEIATRLSKATVSGIEVVVEGAELVWPKTLDGVQPGDSRLVYIDFGRKTDTVSIALRGSITQTIALSPATVEEPLLARAVAKARIASLAAAQAKLPAEDTERRRALRREIVQVSTQHRVLSDETALLVLETEADHARFEVDRRSLVDILAIAASGLTTIARNEIVVVSSPPLVVEERRPQVRGAGAGQASSPSRSRGTSGPQIDPWAAEVPPTGRPAMRREHDAANAPEPSAETERSVEAEGGMEGVASGYGLGAGGFRGRGGRAPAREESALGLTGRGLGGEASGAARDESDVAEARPVIEAQAPQAPPSSALGRRSRARSEETGSMGVPSTELALPDREIESKKRGAPAYGGRMATVMELVASRRTTAAIVESLHWRNDDPGDVIALIALGEALEAVEQPALAARAYASIVDLFPSRADLRRFAAQRLERLDQAGVALAVDSLERAVEQRPDHLTGHRQLAYALFRAGRIADAFDAIEEGLSKHNHRAAEGHRILLEDLGLLGAAWIAREPKRREEIEQRLQRVGSSLPTGPSTRFVLSWETDANDVDFHIYDGRGGHAYYQQPVLSSGGSLYADVTNGYGPECFTIRGKPEAAPYDLRIHYYSRGPMGYGMGELEIVEYDGQGGLTVGSRPFLIMNDGAYVELGTIGGSS